MTAVLAALDNSLAAGPVLATASALGHLLGADVCPVHVRVGKAPVPRDAVEALGLELVELRGNPVDELVHALSDDDAVAIVLGTRATPGGPRPMGSTALAVATQAAKPVLVVPPDAPHAGRLDRVLVPFEGNVSTSLAPREVIELAASRQVEVIVLHVLEEESLPAFTDQPQHETEAWAHEFLARYCPWAVELIRFEWRVGRREETIVDAVSETDADLVALGWAQELAAGRSPVVRAVLARSHVPVLLIPVLVRNPGSSSARPLAGVIAR